MSKNKGFTLIELLVVMAIIGILSSVVIASLKTARKKAEGAEQLSTREWCDKYHSNDSIDYLPAKCFSHFGINTINN